MKRKNRRMVASYTVIIAIMLLISAFIILPYIWMLASSFKSNQEILTNPKGFLPRQWTLGGYANVLSKTPFFSWFKNSLLVTTATTFMVLLTSTLTGFVFAKYEFKGKKALFWSILAVMMVPQQITMIPTFILINTLGLYNHLSALIIPGLVSCFGIFLCKQFIEDIPNSLCEAALIDGAGDFYIYFKVIIPQIRPAIASLAIFTFLAVWNDYINPLIMLNDLENMTLPLALSFFSDQHSTDLGAIMAASALVMLPVTIVFLAFQKQFIKGISLTGMK